MGIELQIVMAYAFEWLYNIKTTFETTYGAKNKDLQIPLYGSFQVTIYTLLKQIMLPVLLQISKTLKMKRILNI